MMEITIKINGRLVSVEVSADVADYLEQAKRNNRKLYREHQRYWDGRECDEYIIATEGRLPYYESPEQYVPYGNPQRNFGGTGALHREATRAVFAPCSVRFQL